jgi:hypothetical protein
MINSKYIVIQIGGGLQMPIIFSSLQQHDVVARPFGGKVLGAGFCVIYLDDSGRPKYDCYGESVSLDIKSRGEVDAQVLNRMLGVV